MRRLVIAFALLFLSSCGLSPVAKDPQFEYTRAHVYKNLELPPDLIVHNEQSFDIPGVDEVHNSVPDYQNAKLVRDGNNTWLEVDGKMDLIWQRLHDFLAMEGLKIKSSDKLTGLITTTWLKNQTGIAPGDLLDNIQAEFLNSKYMDQYVISVERMSAFRVRIVVMHNAMGKVMLEDNENGSLTDQWVKLPPNPILQLTLLKKFMAYSGLSSSLGKQGFDKTALQQIFKDKVLKSKKQQHYILVRRTPEYVFEKITKNLDDYFDIDAIRQDSKTILISYPDNKPEKKKKDSWFGWFDNNERILRIEVQPVGDYSRIVVREKMGKPVDPKTDLEVLNTLMSVPVS